MKKIIPLMLGLFLSLAVSPPTLAKEKKKHKHKKVVDDDKEPWACVKNGKIISVKGKNDRQKQDHCEQQFGIWEKNATLCRKPKDKGYSMSLQLAESKTAQEAFALVKELQADLVKTLDTLPPPIHTTRFQSAHWLRAQGAFGGGNRFVAMDEALFNRASVNVSQVHYEKDPTRKLASASALSSIVHPRNPFAPSMHMHISWTEMKNGNGYWRIMGDLNPSIPQEADTEAFLKTIHEATGKLFAIGKAQGERYFHIPALGRHRGVAHFYLEDFRSDDAKADIALARTFGQRLIETYAAIVSRNLSKTYTATEQRQQLDYHSLYFLQVLLLDRGTTSGLLIHDENDTGILGSLPSHVDKELLRSWLPQHAAPQQILLSYILETLPDGPSSLVDDTVKVRIAQISREFYRQHPAAQELLARGDVVPPTQDNHR